MSVRRDHVGGGAFIVAGAAVLAASTDLPFGTLASPGAGMLPTLVVALMMLFGAVLLARAGEGPLLSATSWSDLPHAIRVAIAAAAGAALYPVLGFLLTVPLLLFTLIFVVERKPLLPAVAFSVGVTAVAYVLFTTLLKTPVPPVPRELLAL
jgi:hypothetical protein